MLLRARPTEPTPRRVADTSLESVADRCGCLKRLRLGGVAEKGSTRSIARAAGGMPPSATSSTRIAQPGHGVSRGDKHDCESCSGCVSQPSCRMWVASPQQADLSDSRSAFLRRAHMDGYSIRQGVFADEVHLHALDHIARHDEDRRSTIDRAVREERCWIVERDEIVVGYGIISHAFFGRSFLELIYIDVSRRGQGLGPMLIRVLEQQSKTTSLFTSTNQSNAHMRHVLERLGYEPSGRIDNLDPGDPEIIYVKHAVRAD